MSCSCCVSYLDSSSVLGTSQNLSQPVAAAGKQTSKPPKTSQAPHHSGEEPSRAEEPRVPQAKNNRPTDGHTATYPRNQNTKKRLCLPFPYESPIILLSREQAHKQARKVSYRIITGSVLEDSARHYENWDREWDTSGTSSRTG
jgi:hypothetical protein